MTFLYLKIRVGVPFLHWFGLEKLFHRYGVDVMVWAHEHFLMKDFGQFITERQVLTDQSRIFQTWTIHFNFSNVSAISWRPVLVVEEAGVPGENHRPWASNW